MTDGFYWYDKDGILKTAEQKVEEYRQRAEARRLLAKRLVDCALAGNRTEAFSVAVKTPIDGADLLAIIVEAVKQGGSDPAKKLATLRHAENYELANDAVRYWRENIDPTLSAAKAANELMKVVPLSHKKLAEIVSAEKKKLS